MEGQDIPFPIPHQFLSVCFNSDGRDPFSVDLVRRRNDADIELFFAKISGYHASLTLEPCQTVPFVWAKISTRKSKIRFVMIPTNFSIRTGRQPIL
jgi:hypothetical protein